MAEVFKGPRIAERREDVPHPKLDYVVVIPCHDEDVHDVMESLISIADQTQDDSDAFIQGVVVVVNGKPSDELAKKLANNNVYRALQLLHAPMKVTFEGDEQLQEQFEYLRESNLPIDVIDAFSDGHAHSENNVSYARKIGTEFADLRLKAGNTHTDYMTLTQSLDADTTVGPGTIRALRHARRNKEGDVFKLRAHWRREGLTDEERWASGLYDFQYKMNSAIAVSEALAYSLRNVVPDEFDPQRKRDSVERGVVWLGGASTVMSSQMLRQTPGYDAKLTAGEDTAIGHELQKVGAVITHLADRYPDAYVMTQPRVSDRTGAGFGGTIGKFSKPLSEIRVDDPMADKIARNIFEILVRCKEKRDANTPDKELRDWFIEATYNMEDFSFFQHTDEEMDEIFNVFLRWDGSLNSAEHHGLISKVREVCGRHADDISFERLAWRVDFENEMFEAIAGDVVFNGVGGDESRAQALVWRRDFMREGFLKVVEECGVVMDADPKLLAGASADICFAQAYNPVAVTATMSLLRRRKPAEWIYEQLEIDPKDKQVLKDARVIEEALEQNTDERVVLAEKAARHQYIMSALDHFIELMAPKLREDSDIFRRLVAALTQEETKYLAADEELEK